jgi:hypothetical protein
MGERRRASKMLQHLATAIPSATPPPPTVDVGAVKTAAAGTAEAEFAARLTATAGAASPTPSDTATPRPSGTPQPTATPRPTDTTMPTATPMPTNTRPPQTAAPPATKAAPTPKPGGQAGAYNEAVTEVHVLVRDGVVRLCFAGDASQIGCP